jgi:DNA replication protein DnaC
MEAMKQLSQFEAITEASKLAKSRMDQKSEATSAEESPNKKKFIPEFRNCETHGRYQINVEAADGVRFLTAHCPVCFRQKQAAKLFEKSNIPPRFASCSFDNYVVESGAKQEKVLISCKSFADGFEQNHKSGLCLLLCGNPGTGKNHLATAICKQVMQLGYSVLRVKASQFLDTFWGKKFDEREQWLNEIAKVDLLFIDEIGRSSETKNSQDAFFRLIDARYEAVLPTIMATNLNREELIEVLGEAAYDRLRQGGSTRLTFDWESRRGSS